MVTKSKNPSEPGMLRTWYRDWESFSPRAFESLAHHKRTDSSFVTIKKQSGRDNKMYNLTEGFNLKKFDGFTKTTAKTKSKTDFDEYLKQKLVEKARLFRKYKEIKNHPDSEIFSSHSFMDSSESSST